MRALLVPLALAACGGPPVPLAEARIRADARTRWQDVVAAVEMCTAAEVPCVFDRYGRPSERLRRCMPLPLPRR